VLEVGGVTTTTDITTETRTLVEDVTALVGKYVVVDDAQKTAVALWTLHTHVPEAMGITPYLAITSAEMGSGKTRLLEILRELVREPWFTGSVSAATLARKIHAQRPTLLLDESDAAFGGDREYAETLRGVLNSGYRASGTYSRCVGGSGTNLNVDDFSTFCPKAIAGIGSLPDTVADRSIPIRLKKKSPGESVDRFVERIVAEQAALLRERIERWAEEADLPLAELRLAPLDELPDRAADVWEPLLGIAHLAGEKWYSRARKAAIELSGRGARDDESLGVRMLADCKAAFTDLEVASITSEQLVSFLHEIEESPWAEFRRGQPISKVGVARILKPFEIEPSQWRNGETRCRGYLETDFHDAWSRYLPPTPPSDPGQSGQPFVHQGLRANSQSGQDPDCPDSKNGATPHGYADVPTVPTEQGGNAAPPLFHEDGGSS
jgi:hypothetical protein